MAKIPLFKSLTDRIGEALVQRYGSPDYAALDSEMRKTFVKVISQDLSEYYPRFSHSTLLVWGRQDTETPLWMGKKMEEWIPDAGLVGKVATSCGGKRAVERHAEMVVLCLFDSLKE